MLSNAIGVWHIPELWPQIFAACTGAIVVAVVTMVLMHGQRATEESKGTLDAILAEAQRRGHNTTKLI